MAAISIIPTNGDYYKIQATIINNSNIEITSMGLSLQVGGGAVIGEKLDQAAIARDKRQCICLMLK